MRQELFCYNFGTSSVELTSVEVLVFILHKCNVDQKCEWSRSIGEGALKWIFALGPQISLKGPGQDKGPLLRKMETRTKSNKTLAKRLLELKECLRHSC